MGCRCGGGRGAREAFPPPAGVGGRLRKMMEQPSGMLDPARNPSRVVARSRGGTQTFTLQTSDGRTLTFGSRLEAVAAQRRTGGGTINP